MTMVRFIVRHVGPHTTVQDAGRPGLMRFGVPASGPMDRHSFAIANAALGNPDGAAGIEISLGGLVLDCTEGSISVALVGGDFQMMLGAAKLGANTVVTVAAGDRLTIRPGAFGSWAYLAFAGQLRSKTWLGSAATHATSGLGGGVLVTGVALTIDAESLRNDRNGPIETPALLHENKGFRVVLGPQDRFFSAKALDDFLSQPFTLTDAYDRMGVRLAGPSLRPTAALDMPSEPILRGSVQVAGDGVATVLLADHQTTGGYPKIATILSCDLDAFAQLRSKASIRFHAVTPAEAITAVRAHYIAEQDLLRGLCKPKLSLDQRLLSMNLIDGMVNASD